jgi:hypothetical protein
MCKSLNVNRIAYVAAAIWLLCVGPAWAGGGGMDAEGLQATLSGICSILNIPCPQFPTYATTVPTPISPLTPIVVELSAWENMTPDYIRINDSDCAQFGTEFGGTLPYCPQVAINAINGPAKFLAWDDPPGATSPSELSYLTPLAFVSSPTSSTLPPLTATQYGDPAANSFFYAVALDDQHGQPQTLDLFYDYVAGMKNWGPKGQVTAVISLPLAVLVKNAATEGSVVATLTAICNGPGSCAIVKVNLSGNFPGNGSYQPADLGLSFTYYLGTSPNSSSPHPIVEVQVPLLVNTQTDPFYFISTPLPGCANGGNLISGYCNAFSSETPPNGFAPKFLKNTVVGMAPSAAPQCPGAQPGTLCPTTYPTNPTRPLSPTFGFCASFNGSKQPAAAFFLAIGTDGTTYVSSPVAPALSGAPYPACPS